MSGTIIIASCILKWIYEQASALLQIIKQILIAILALIDALIIQIRMFIAMLEPMALLNQLVEIIDAVIQALIDQFLSMFKQYGPGLDTCPEFYHYLVDPIQAYIKSFVAAFDPIRESIFAEMSLTSVFDSYLEYWTSTKAFLTAVLDVIDDALYQALVNEGADLATN